MTPPPQEFTFVNVTAGKKANTTTIKRHVSSQTNRRKRQEAVNRYQASLLQAAEESTSSGEASSSSDQNSIRSGALTPASSVAEISNRPISPSKDRGDSEAYREQFGKQRSMQRPELPQSGRSLELYLDWVRRNTDMLLSQDASSSSNNDASKLKPLTTITSNNLRSTSRIQRGTVLPSVVGRRLNQYTTMHIPRIDPPPEFARLQWTLKSCSDFVRGTYGVAWRGDWLSREWFLSSITPLGVWHECFPLAIDFIYAGKVNEAFHIVNAAMSATAAVFKQMHPGLISSALGAITYTCLIEDEKLRNLIRTHIIQLSILHLGRTHPIPILLREQIRVLDTGAGDRDLIFRASIDSHAECFGPTHFLPVMMKFGHARMKTRTGDHKSALVTIEEIEKASLTTRLRQDKSYTTDLSTYTALERARMHNTGNVANRTDNQSTDVDSMADKVLERDHSTQDEGLSPPLADSKLLKKLSRYLLAGGYHTLSHYIWTKPPRFFARSSPLPHSVPTCHNPESLPDIVTLVLVDYFRRQMSRSDPES